ncbi:hypothetical protein D915_002917 [Fasciola hepatica]|uniref:Autophagy-related protein 13 n=1 Tax=Fasciola hepatica TaxID=6192 RepID=A0A4E0S1E3_FASHE|nr:hypothetical protein D915_002917 [Fasciola hepatica]
MHLVIPSLIYTSMLVTSLHLKYFQKNIILHTTNFQKLCLQHMINIEEDPEIGATIKHTFDPGFPVHVGDVISLEILASWPGDRCMLVEIWQFRLDTAEKLDQIPNSTTGSVFHRPNSAVVGATGSDTTQPVEVVGEDSRFFEKLGTLLKTLIVATRLLPAYKLARRQSSADYAMCYNLRRGTRDLNRLGPGLKSQLVGRLLSGLALSDPSGTCGAATDTKSVTMADPMRKVYLNACVHYRTQVQPSPHAAYLPLVEGIAKLVLPQINEVNIFTQFQFLSCFSFDAYKSHRAAASRDHSHRATNPRDVGHPERHSPRALPAFADISADDQNEDDFDPAGALLLRGNVDEDAQDEMIDQVLSDDDSLSGSDSSFGTHEPSSHNCPHRTGRDDGGYPATRLRGTGSEDVDEIALNEPTLEPLGGNSLQAAFSNFSSDPANKLGLLFVNLRKQADLDLFRVPHNSGGATGGSGNAQAQSSVFNAKALSDELKRHEETLKEFDDFLTEFCSVDLFGPAEVRQLTAPVQPR